MHRTPQAFGRQRGAALVVGLLLLVILTLLAISGMNTASTELVMAGNEQFRQRAFNSASAGIEQRLETLAKVNQSLDTPTVVTKTINGDEYTTSTLYKGDDTNIPDFSVGRFVGIHYQVLSTGKSKRDATTVHTQGAYVIQTANAGGNKLERTLESVGIKLD
jgi:type IV pilus assembly protein PilX